MTTESRETATFCATLVDEWARAGLTDTVVAPGSRNTPLVLALAADDRLRTHVVLDERSAGFVALGLAVACGRPTVVACTSGTAAAELHAAIVEAHHSAVPLIVCTADRPPELQQIGAPQTIDQSRLFGGALRFFVDPGPPDDGTRGSWRSLASRVVLEATGARPGPVQLNLPFREPLVGAPGPLPPGRADGAPWQRRAALDTALAPSAAAELVAAWSGRRGLLVAGRCAGVRTGDRREGTAHADGGGAALLALASRLGWPVLADPRSGCRVEHPCVVAHADALLRDPDLAERLRPEIVVGIGEPPASKVVNQWLASGSAPRYLSEPSGRMLDPDRDVAVVLEVAVGALHDALWGPAPGGGLGPLGVAAPSNPPEPAPAAWSAAWRAADDAAAAALDLRLAACAAPTEPGTARALLAATAEGDRLVVSSSMPVRDLEWYGPRGAGAEVVANRGANGIDGVVSTAVGVALAGAPTWLLIGDLALLHDANGLLGSAARPVRLRLVVIDNGGGGIFSFLPQAAGLPAATFERFFGTPQSVDVGALLELHGIHPRYAATAQELTAGLRALAASTDPVAALVVSTDRAANVADHASLNAAMAEAARRAVP